MGKTIHSDADSGKEKPWKLLQIEVAGLYQELGAINVGEDVNIDGNQIDVYAEVPAADGHYIRTIVSCKCYARPAGVQDVREWNMVYRALLDTCKADRAVIVSPKGFSQDAAPLAKSLGIPLITLDQLKWASCNFQPYVRSQLEELRQLPLFAKNRYIPLRISHDGSKEVILALDAVQAFVNKSLSPLLTILGDYGAGKTTLCRSLFIYFAERFLAGEAGARMPIYLNLRDYPSHINLQSFVTDLLVNQFRARCPGFESIKRLSKEGKLLVLFDAFDEMATRSDYATTLSNFRALEVLFQEAAKVILTCRTHYYKDQDELHTVHAGTELYQHSKKRRYEIIYIQSLLPDEIKTYVQAVSGDNWQEHYETICSTYNLPALARRPILLDMITEVLPALIEKKQDVTSTRLYAHYTDLWLKRDDWRTVLSRQQKQRFTIAFAYAMYQRNATSFSWSDVENAISLRFPQSTSKEKEHYQYDIRTCSFIRRDPSSEAYAFVHESFMEYFVSAHLYDLILKRDWDEFGSRIQSPQVINFLAEHLATNEVISNLFAAIKAPRTSELLGNSLALLSRWSPVLNSYHWSDINSAKLQLSNLRMTDVSFTRSQFAGFTFVDCFWKDSRIDRATFDKTELIRTVVENLDFLTSSFLDIRCVDCKFTRCGAEHCEISGEFTNTELVDCVFADDSSLKGCTFSSGSISGCDFSSSSLMDSRFINVKFSGNTWSLSSLDGVVFEDVVFSDEGKSFFASAKGQESLAWRKAPIFINIPGIAYDVKARLGALGATFIE